MTIICKLMAICGGLYGIALCVDFLRQRKLSKGESVLDMEFGYKGYFYVILSLYWFCLKLKFCVS